MADPFRLTVLKALTECLKQIDGTNGYQTNVEGRVYRGRIEFGEEDALPLISILETPVPPDELPTPQGGTTSYSELDILIQGFVVDDINNPTDPAYILQADIKKALVAERKKGRERERNILGLGERVDGLEIGTGTVRPSDEISAVAYCWLRVVLKIVEDNENPYV